MSPVDIAGHCAYLTIFIGQALLARRRRLGWLARVTGDSTWVVLGLTLGMTSIALWGSIFVVQDVIAWRGWSSSKLDGHVDGPADPIDAGRPQLTAHEL